MRLVDVYLVTLLLSRILSIAWWTYSRSKVYASTRVVVLLLEYIFLYSYS